MSHDDMISVIAAHKMGKAIESRERRLHTARWEHSRTPIFDFFNLEYRIKPPEPPPKPREFWIKKGEHFNYIISSAYDAIAHRAQDEGFIHVREIL